jgi:hypothetical protein
MLRVIYDPEGGYPVMAAVAPWVSDAQVEQDLVISRALVTIFKDTFISDQSRNMMLSQLFH